MIQFRKFTEEKTTIYKGKHWSGSMMPMLQTAYSKKKFYPNARFMTPELCVMYGHISPKGNTHVAEPKSALFCLDVKVDEGYNEDQQKKVHEFYILLKKKVDEMLELAYNMPEFEVHKDKYKDKDVFKQNATLSLFKEINGQRVMNFRRKYVFKNNW